MIEEGINILASICSIENRTTGHVSYQNIPEPPELGKILLSKIGISLPDAIPCRKEKCSQEKKMSGASIYLIDGKMIMPESAIPFFLSKIEEEMGVEENRTIPLS